MGNRAPFTADRCAAEHLDDADELAAFRARFAIRDPGLVYLDGNSLGRLPRASEALAAGIVEGQWGDRLIRSWNDRWFHLPERVGEKIARLLGAEPDEVIVADSTSVNLFKLALAALRHAGSPARSRVLSDDMNFPSDLYILQSVVDLASSTGVRHRLDLVRSPDGCTVPTGAVTAALGDDTALLALSHVAFKSAYTYDMEHVTEAAHDAGALVLWDTSHSVGAMPLFLRKWGVDLAVGCTYKYLNGGPGAPAFLYIRRELQQALENPIAGWFGRHDPFGFSLGYQPDPGIRRFLTGTPPVLSLALIEPGVDLVLEAGIERIREKSVRQTEYVIALWEALLAPVGFGLGSPRDARLRGSHVSITHPDGFRMCRALVERMNVIPDFRAPDTIRLGICPLYTTYTELHTAVTSVRTVLIDGLHEAYGRESHGVT
jgi:kynureninase